MTTELHPESDAAGCRVMSAIPTCGSLKARSISSAPRRCAPSARSDAQCLAEALNRAEPWGVWGGEILDRGSIVARKRPRGRPRKITGRPEAA